MTGRGPIAVTGTSGRVGGALLAVLRDMGREVREWRRPEFDLDDPHAADRLVQRDRPALVYHAAGWTDVDACARQPDLAMRRNGTATAELAAACAAAGCALVYLSTNEVFDGVRTDRTGYRETDTPNPINAYGRSKLAGEEAVGAAFGEAGEAWIVRTSWVFGHPGNDFPARIVAAADRLSGLTELPVVADEIGRPTFAGDLAAALVRLASVAPPGIVHIANEGHASRLEWARRVLARCRPAIRVKPIGVADFDRPSRPPAWAVLDTTLAEGLGLRLPPWEAALDAYLSEICPS